MIKNKMGLKIVLAAVMVISFCLPCMAADFTPKAGNYYKQTYGDVTFHTYTTPTKFAASASLVVETPSALILQDVQQNKPNNADLKGLIDALNKPLKRIYISHNHDHHWIGLEDFPGVPVYASAMTIEGMKKTGDAALAEARKNFGEKMVPYSKVVIPENVVHPGEETIEGVRMVFGTPMMQLTGPVNFIEFPDQNVLVHHHLAYVDVHVPMPPASVRAKALEDMKKKGYQYLIGGHGTPCKADKYYAETIGYFTKLAEVVEKSASPDAAVAAMQTAYPEWGGVFLLKKIMPANFKK